MLLKTISIFLVVSFVLQDLGHAAGEIASSPSAPRNDKVIYLIQDAHTNPSAQLSIAKTLEALLSAEGARLPDRQGSAALFGGEKEKIQTVFLEGGFGDVSLAGFKSKASLQKRREVGLNYLRKGELSGAEYFNLVSDKDFSLWGVEDEALYWKSLEIYRQVASKRSKWRDYLGKVENTASTLKPRIFNEALYVFDENREKFLKKEITFTAYLLILMETAKNAGLDPGNFYTLNGLAALKEKEAAIDFQKASEEQLQFTEAESVLASEAPRVIASEARARRRISGGKQSLCK